MIARTRKAYFLEQFIPLCVWSLISAILFLSGCGSATLPDIKPFAEQTTKMASAASNAYTQAEGLLSATDIETGKPKDDEIDPITQLKQDWEQTRQALHAMVAYSNALAALADTGAEGSESADAVANALDGLLSVVGVGKVSENLMGALKKANEFVAAVRAKKSLKEAIEQAQPAIDAMCKIIAANLADLEIINHAAGKQVEKAHTEANKPMKSYYEALMEADKEILEILALILKYQGGDDESLSRLKKLDKGLPRDLTRENVEQRRKHWIEKSKAVQTEANRYLSKYQIYIAELTKIRSFTKNGNEIIRKSRVAVEMWPTAHRQLKIALDKKHRMSLIEYAVIVQDIYNAYQKGDN